MRYYAGIGSRKTPIEVCTIMTQIASKLEEKGFCLRSGGAEGADLAFENGVKDPKNKQIFLPKQGFNGSTSKLYLLNMSTSQVHQAFKIACQYYHSHLPAKDQGTQNYMTRNTFQILGYPLEKDLSEFAVCWTEDGKASGGTGQALRICIDRGIPIYNLRNPEDLNRLNAFLLSLD